MYKKGFNKANFYENILWRKETEPAIEQRPCIFLSHKREDKEACNEIAAYIRDAGIDYYLDIEDKDLQNAAIANDPLRITEIIKKGIRNSTHMLIVVSEQTYKSLWVPFEVGYGHASILDQDRFSLDTNKIKLSVLTLKDISEKSLPDYLRVAYVIKGTKSLNSYINKINENSSINEVKTLSYSQMSHPLDSILNWKL